MPIVRPRPGQVTATTAPATPAAAPVQTAPSASVAPPIAKPEVKQATIERPVAPVAAPASTALSAPSTQSTAIGEPLPEYLQQYQNDRSGKEEMTAEDAGTPRIRLLQSMSDEVTGVGKGVGKGLANGYTPGLLYFPPLDMILGDEITVVFLLHSKEWVRFGNVQAKEPKGLLWKMKPRDVDKFPARRGDLEWNEGSPPKADFTHNFLAMLYDPATDKLDSQIGPAVISLAKTNTKCAEGLCQALLPSAGPMFIRVFTLKSRQVPGPKGPYYVLDPRPAGLIKSQQTAKALEGLHRLISGKDLVVDYGDAEETTQTPAQAQASSGSF